jgi:hypothetical protein
MSRPFELERGVGRLVLRLPLDRVLGDDAREQLDHAACGNGEEGKDREGQRTAFEQRVPAFLAGAHAARHRVHPEDDRDQGRKADDGERPA